MASADLLKVINAEVETGEFHNAAGDLLIDPISDMLVDEHTTTAYPITTDIPQLLPKLAISLTGLNLGKSFD